MQFEFKESEFPEKMNDEQEQIEIFSEKPDSFFQFDKKMKPKGTALRDLLITSLFLIFSFVGVIGIVLVYGFVTGSITNQTSLAIAGVVIQMVSGFVATFLLIGLFFRKEYAKDTKNFFTNGLSYFKVLGYFFIMLILLYFTNDLIARIFPDSGTTVNQQTIESMINKDTILLFGLLICVYAPIVEEFTYRFLIINRVLGRTPYLIKLILPALFFAGIHVDFMQPTTQVLYELFSYAPIALCLGFIYIKENNIWYSILIHCFYNSVGFVAILF
ncbi:MAG: lysostaphin resistance A-like protein, partial [Mycoplasmatales bacterium]